MFRACTRVSQRTKKHMPTRGVFCTTHFIKKNSSVNSEILLKGVYVKFFFNPYPASRSLSPTATATENRDPKPRQLGIFLSWVTDIGHLFRSIVLVNILPLIFFGDLRRSLSCYLIQSFELIERLTGGTHN